MFEIPFRPFICIRKRGFAYLIVKLSQVLSSKKLIRALTADVYFQYLASISVEKAIQVFVTFNEVQ